MVPPQITSDYNALMLSECSKIGMKPICDEEGGGCDARALGLRLPAQEARQSLSKPFGWTPFMSGYMRYKAMYRGSTNAAARQDAYIHKGFESGSLRDGGINFFVDQSSGWSATCAPVAYNHAAKATPALTSTDEVWNAGQYGAYSLRSDFDANGAYVGNSQRVQIRSEPFVWGGKVEFKYRGAIIFRLHKASDDAEITTSTLTAGSNYGTKMYASSSENGQLVYVILRDESDTAYFEVDNFVFTRQADNVRPTGRSKPQP